MNLPLRGRELFIGAPVFEPQARMQATYMTLLLMERKQTQICGRSIMSLTPTPVAGFLGWKQLIVNIYVWIFE
jgi:hypothetical protein